MITNCKVSFTSSKMHSQCRVH